MRILICPLNWGLGHAARCVPLIRELRGRGHEIVIGASDRAREFLARQFPDVECLGFPGISLRYPVTRRFAFFYLARLPYLVWHLGLEHHRLKKLLSARRFDLLISDGRLGLFSRRCPAVLITHQLLVACPRWRFGGVSWGAWAERLFYPYVWPLFRCFDEIWVPDRAASPNLSGALSHRRTFLRNVRYIGPLSRFGPPEGGAIRVDRLALISGPEPQRTLIERKLRSILARLPGRNVMVLGKPEEAGAAEDLARLEAGRDGLTILPHAGEEILGRLIRGADLIVARSGYTTIMELSGLGVRKVLFVPTPGQPEQEYLARHLEEMRIAPWKDQRALASRDLQPVAWTHRGFSNLLPREDRSLRIPVPAE